MKKFEISQVEKHLPDLVVLGLITAYWGHVLGECFDQRWIQDDSYISFRYAKNWVQGSGIVYNAGERLEGYSNFLWMAISAIPLLFGKSDPIFFTQLLGIALLAATVVIFGITVVKTFGLRSGILASSLIPLASFMSYQLWFVAGMETGLVAFLISCILLCLVAGDRSASNGRYSAIGLGFACAGLLLTRFDHVFVVSSALGIDAWLRFKRQETFRKIFQASFSVAVVILPFVIWKVLYYGSLFPNTYYVKMADRSFYERGWEYFKTFLSIYPLSIPALVVLAASVWGEREKRVFFVSVFSISFIHSFYLIRLGGDFMEWRFMVPVAGLIVIGFGPAVSSLAIQVASRYRRSLVRNPPFMAKAIYSALHFGTAGLLTMGLVSGNQKSRQIVFTGQETIESLGKYAKEGFEWNKMGLILDEILPKDAVIATSAAGMLPYFSNRKVLDMLGLNDPMAKEEVKKINNRGRVGHEYELTDLNIIKARGASVVVHWPDLNLSRLRPALIYVPQDGRQKVSVSDGNGRYFTFLVLSPELVNSLKERHDSRITFYDTPDAGIQHVKWDLKNEVPSERTPWDCPKCIKIEKSIELQIDGTNKGRNFTVAFDHNDKYTLFFYSGNQLLDTVSVGPVEHGGGLHQYKISIKNPNRKKIGRIVIQPSIGDEMYSMGGLSAE